MNVDMNKTKEYYLSNDSVPCECAYCQNYIFKIEQKYPAIVQYLASMNIDATRPFELMSVELDKIEVEYSLCQYIVYGDCEEDYHSSIDGIEFGKSSCHPSTNIKGNHFVLEFGPVVLRMA